ncbi:hypothetical protein ACFPYM_11610, partial [Methylobacterium hispanicum]
GRPSSRGPAMEPTVPDPGHRARRTEARRHTAHVDDRRPMKAAGRRHKQDLNATSSPIDESAARDHSLR